MCEKKNCEKKEKCEKNKCGKKSQCEFHSLTKEIACLQLERNKLYEKNMVKCKTKTHCSICLCFNPDNKIITDSGEVSNLCTYCVNKVQKNNNPKKAPYEYECPVCGEIDGIFIIKGLTNNMCSSCFAKINKL